MFLTLVKQLFLVLLCDGLLVGVAALLLAPLAIYRKAAWAVLKRNFVSYFTTPTGYVFLCLFVLLSSFAAFWPHDFFASNMATLDQLNFWIPLILLMFIPAITMSIWAEERRQGTDELLLTIPASDIDIVLGKYLAAAAIFTASLLFSQLANFSVLNVLADGGVDLGLYFSTYIGYWFMGMAMLAVGMVASFLTTNLTVGFILGAVFNAPLALANYADVIIANAGTAQLIRGWGMWSNFQDFGRGVISISSVVYFMVIVAVGLYLSVVLIGRRHWLGGKDGPSMLGHYLVRSAAIIAMALGSVVLLANNDFVRKDLTSANINSLSPQTYKLLDELQVTRPIRIEAFISKSLPENYVRTKYDVINVLKELDSRGGNDIKVAINDQMEPYSPEADKARESYEIVPVAVPNESFGTASTEQVFLAAAVTSGPERVVLKFFGPGTPIEYEIISAIVTVANRKKVESSDESGGNDARQLARVDGDSANNGDRNRSSRKVIGIMRTDSQITGGFDLEDFFHRLPEKALVTELRKQYDVEELSPEPVNKDEIDVLVVVQPSSLTSDQLPHVLDAIRAGIPTALFEDPFPAWFRGGESSNAYVPGTDERKRPVGGRMAAMMGRGGVQEKGDIQTLWDLLGVSMVKAKFPIVSTEWTDVVHDYEKDTHKTKVTWTPVTPYIWQKYNPYPKMAEFPGLFASSNVQGPQPAFNPDDRIVSGLQEVLFIMPGAFEEAEKKTAEAKGLNFTPLIRTGERSGINYYLTPQEPGLHEITRQEDVKETKELLDLGIVMIPDFDPPLQTDKQYVLAVRISGKLNSEPKKDGETKQDQEGGAKEPSINVVLVGDMDIWDSRFVQVRSQPSNYINYQFQNVVFVQNIIDDLAGEDQFFEIRKHTPRHAPLKLIEQSGQQADDEAEKLERQAKEQIREEFEQLVYRQNGIEQQLGIQIEAARRAGNQELLEELRDKQEMQRKAGVMRLGSKLQSTQSRVNEEMLHIERDLAVEKRGIQNYFKAMAVILPAIPPLIIAGAVFLARRLRESQGIAQERRR